MPITRSCRLAFRSAYWTGIAACLAIFATPSAVRAADVTLYGYEDAMGVLHVSDRKLSGQYVAVCPYDDRIKRLGFEDLRKLIRGKAAEKKAADVQSPGKFWVSDASTPRLPKPGGTFWGMPGLGVRSLPPPAANASFCPGFSGPGGGRVGRQRLAAPSGELLEAISRHAQRQSVDPHLVYALIEAESNFQVDAVSPKGAQGLMQIMPETGRQLGLYSPFDPDRNIEAGVRYLRLMLDKFGGLPLALAAYNAGPGCVEQYGGVPPIPETMRYVTRVMARYDSLRASSAVLPAKRSLRLIEAEAR